MNYHFLMRPTHSIVEITTNDNRKVAWSSETCNMIPIDKIAKLPKSMADLTTQILALIFHIVMATLAIIMNRANPEDLNEYQYRWIEF